MKYPLPDLATLNREIRDGAPGLAIGGVVPGARALVMAALAEHGWPTDLTLVVVPRTRDAEDLTAGLGLLAPDLRVGLAPAEFAGPYLGTEPSLAARLQTVDLLRRMSDGVVDLVVVPARVLGSPMPVPRAISRATLRVHVGHVVNLEAMAAKLSVGGYRRVDLVEEAGDFAIRGWVVDIHPGGEKGVRLQLDDERVESIRSFDPTSQRSSDEQIEELSLLPIDVFPAEPQVLAEISAHLESEYPALAFQMAAGAERRLWWGALHLGSESTSWLDLAKYVVVCDRDEVTGALARWWQVQDREWRTLSERAVEIPPPDRLLSNPKNLGPSI
ncbi:MAG: hypothetical protein P8127_04415, partial [Acidobacteriota bacterium]